VVVGALLIWKPQIDPVETAKASVFNSELVAKGAELAAVGNCAVCHTTPGAAIADALADATGQHFRELPFTRARVKTALLQNS
jgi:CO/xanthine dehydrogenase Mo-binding subunit